MTLTVSSTTPTIPETPSDGDSTILTDNLEIRLINQTRKANGVPELPVNEALMNAAQICSNRRYTWHHSPEESKAAVDAGYPYGFGDNLTVFTGTADAAQRAVDNWIKKGTLTVRRTLHQRKGGGLTAGETKTGKGRRTITLPPSTAQLLRERRKGSCSQWIFPQSSPPGGPGQSRQGLQPPEGPAEK